MKKLTEPYLSGLLRRLLFISILPHCHSSAQTAWSYSIQRLWPEQNNSLCGLEAVLWCLAAERQVSKQRLPQDIQRQGCRWVIQLRSVAILVGDEHLRMYKYCVLTLRLKLCFSFLERYVVHFSCPVVSVTNCSTSPLIRTHVVHFRCLYTM